MASGASFTISGIEPSEIRAAAEDVRRQYWRWIVELVLDAKDRELAAGLDRFGEDLTEIRERTRKYRHSDMGVADPNAPPLTPAYELSRTRALFDGRAYADRAQFFWRMDAHTGASWGRILRYHADGAGDLPVRDVIGLSPDSLRWVRLQALARWRLHQRAQGVMQTAEDLAFQPATTPGSKQAPPTFKPEGITNLDHFTFGIGGTKEEVQRAINEGYSTGFRQLPERMGSFRPSRTLKPAPVPPPPPPPRPTPAPVPAPAPATRPKAKLAASYPAANYLRNEVEGEVSAAVQQAISAIDSLHTLPRNVLPIPIQGATGPAYPAGMLNLQSQNDGGIMPVGITIRTDNALHPAMTTAHETGHFVDYVVIPGGLSPNRDHTTDPAFAEWVKAIIESPEVQKLRQVRKDTLAQGELRQIVKRADNLAAGKDYVDYLLQSDELWARSYAQWVATRSGNAQLTKELEKDLKFSKAAKMPTQWQPDTFAPIAEAIDGIFRTLGLLLK